MPRRQGDDRQGAGRARTRWHNVNHLPLASGAVGNPSGRGKGETALESLVLCNRIASELEDLRKMVGGRAALDLDAAGGFIHRVQAALHRSAAADLADARS